MRQRSLLSLCALLLFPFAVSAQQSKATVSISGVTKTLTTAVALKGETYGEERVMIVATARPLSPAQIKKVQKKDAEENTDGEVGDVYMKAVFRPNGELRYIFAHTGRTSFGVRCNPEEGSATIADSRIKGSINLKHDGDFAKTITWTFDLPLDAPVSASAPVTFDPPVAPTVVGKFTGNGKPAKLAYASALYHEPFNDKESVTLLFTEKDHSKDPKASIKAVFGDYGSAILLHVNTSCGIFGCEIAHNAHAKSPFTAIGSAELVEFDMSRGNAKGHVKTQGEVDTFEQKWELDLNFAVPLPPEYRQPSRATASSEIEDDDEEDDEAEKEEVIATISALEVPIAEDAINLEYKKLVEQIHYSSPSPVSAVSKELMDAFQRKGWSNASGGVVGKKNTSFKRVKEGAELTVMVKSAPTGSNIVIFTEHLKWDQVPKTNRSKQNSQAKAPKNEQDIRDQVKGILNNTDGIPKEAQDAIDKTLNDIFEDEE